MESINAKKKKKNTTKEKKNNKAMMLDNFTILPFRVCVSEYEVIKIFKHQINIHTQVLCLSFVCLCRGLIQNMFPIYPRNINNLKKSEN